MERHTLTTIDVDTDTTGAISEARTNTTASSIARRASVSTSLATQNSSSGLHIRIPFLDSKFLHLPSPLEFLGGGSITRSRSPSNASSLSALTISSPLSTPTHSSLPISAPFTSLYPHIVLDSVAKVSSFDAGLAVPALWATLPAQSILTLSSISKSPRAKLCTMETFETHLKENGWDTAALDRRTQVLEREKKIPKWPRWLHLARSAVQKERIPSVYRSLPEEKLVKDKKYKVSGMEYTNGQKKVINRLLKTLVDCVTEHDENNLNTLVRLVSAQCNHTSFIHFLSTIPSYNWKSCSLKTFIVAAFINQQPHSELFDESVDYLASSIDFWREGPQKVAKSLSLNNTRSALLYAKGLTAFVHPRPNYNTSKLSSRDYDHTLGEAETFPGLERAIRRFSELHTWNGNQRAVLNLEGTYWKTHEEDCPRSLMRLSISAPSSPSKRLSSLSSLQTLSKLSDLKFQATVHDERHEPWVMQGTLDRSSGRGRMIGSTGALVYELWVVPWGVVGHKIRLGKGSIGEGESLGDFVLIWGEEPKEGVYLSNGLKENKEWKEGR